MGLFDIFKLKAQKQTEFIIPYSKHFKGFKTFPVVVHGYKEAEFNNSYFMDYDYSCEVFRFVPGRYDNGKMMTLFIGNRNVGAIFDQDQIKTIESGKIDKIHAERKVSDKRLRYFVHFKE